VGSIPTVPTMKPATTVTNLSYGSNGAVKRVTRIEREFDEAGNVIKETETITEYEESPNIPWTPPYAPYYPPGQIWCYNGSAVEAEIIPA